VVIVPGITSPAITWESFAAELARDFQVFVFGVRGRGLSDRPATGYRLAEYAADLAGFVSVLGLERAVVLGHSMGARIAAAFGVMYPEQRGPLALVEPPLSGPGRPAYPTTLQQLLDPVRASRAGVALDTLRRANPKWSEEQHQIRAEWLATCDENAVIESYRGFHEEDFFEYWPRLTPPLLFVHGEESPVVTASDIVEVKQANPGAAYRSVRSAGHMIPWDNPDGLLEVVRSFVHAHLLMPHS
jgi:N-formylmaleamate deformylase